MKIIRCDSYKSLSKKVADKIMQKLQPVKKPVFCAASGESPKGLYKELARRHHKGLLDTSNWYFLGLDEWLGLNKNNEGSCHYTLNLSLFNPLNIKEEHVYFFDGKADNPTNECNRIEKFINSYGPIDIAVLGVGMNGHIGFNEPGTSFLSRSHVSDLDTITQEVGQKYFPKKKQLSKGITIGLANLMEAKQLVLIASGSEKASIVQQALERKISEELPVTLLRRHSDLTVYLDKAAAGLLDSY